MLGAWAEVTTRIEFGPLVSSIGYRNPKTAHSAQIGHICTLELVIADRAPAAQAVPPEYSIGWLTCAIASRLDAVMVGWPGAAQETSPPPSASGSRTCRVAPVHCCTEAPSGPRMHVPAHAAQASR